MLPTTISVAFQTDKAISAYGPLAAAAEGYGFAGVSVYNDLLFQPAWLPLLEIARATSRVRIGPAAVNPFTCHPLNIAGNIALINEAAQGRAYLGLARGGWLDYLGLQPLQPVTALHETMLCVRRLLHGNPDPFSGQVFQLAGGESLRWQIDNPDIPFLLGSWGPKTIKACITQIDEVKIGGTANPELARLKRRVLNEAAAEAKRHPAEIGLVVGAVTVVDEDGPAARAKARREAALYLSIVGQLDPTLNIEPELWQRIQEASGRYDYDQVARNISDSLLQRLTFAGTPDQIAAQTAALFEAGVNRVEFGTPHGLTYEQRLRLLGTQVLPALRQAGWHSSA